MKPLKKIPFFLFLLVLFFCLHGWVENYGFIRVSELIIPGLVISGCILSATTLVWLFTKNYLYAALIVFFISLWYLFFGALHDWIKTVPVLSFLKSYPAITGMLLLATIAWIIFLQRKKKLHTKLAVYLNLLLLIYCLVDVFALIKSNTAKPGDQAVNSIRFDTAAVTQKPDVYFLLFDGYPGFTSLKDSFGFSNDSIYNYFVANSFKIMPVYANYYHTYFSMSSMLNMNYVKKDYNTEKLTQRDFQKRGVEINHAAVFTIFKSMGYQIHNLSVFDIDDKPGVSDENSFLLAHSILLKDKIFHYRVIRDIGDRLSRVFPFWKNSDFYQHDINNKLTEELLLKQATAKSSSPEFVYAHFMTPHGPYYYDSASHKNLMEKISHYTMWKDKDLFISYLKYTNNRVLNMLNIILNHNPDAIILVMGDHGFRYYNSHQPFQPALFDNLCALRFPDNKHAGSSQKWSIVNLFPYIFNNEFGQHIPFRSDSTFLLSY